MADVDTSEPVRAETTGAGRSAFEGVIVWFVGMMAMGGLGAVAFMYVPRESPAWFLCIGVLSLAQMAYMFAILWIYSRSYEFVLEGDELVREGTFRQREWTIQRDEVRPRAWRSTRTAAIAGFPYQGPVLEIPIRGGSTLTVGTVDPSMLRGLERDPESLPETKVPDMTLKSPGFARLADRLGHPMPSPQTADDEGMGWASNKQLALLLVGLAIVYLAFTVLGFLPYLLQTYR